MVSEFGHFLLISAFCLNLGLIANYLTRKPVFWGLVVLFNRLESLLLTLLAISFLFLIISFITSDFSVKLVANNSHSLKPILYKVAGAWGNHEGSMLLWVLILSLYLFLFQLSSNNYPKELVRNILLVQLSIIALFLFYLLFLSNPFERLNFPPLNGQDLNPILQDVLLVAHPPILYLGYLGLSIPFSIAIGLLLTNDNTTNIVKLIRFWALVPFVFLTLGILLGSIWAYYELGWGGWWFWDPVENVSLLPWLLNLALIHSILILERRSSLLNWTILLCIMGFSFSMIGTFIVRSGLITSVHAFANDPSRGLFILLIIFVAITTSLSIYIFKRPNTVSVMKLNFASRELWILVQNLTLLVITVIVFLGTIWPFIIEVLLNEQVSVGEPFYEISLLPFAVIFAFMLPIASKVAWKGKNFVDIKKLLSSILICSGVSASGFLIGTLSPLTFIGFFLASWVCLSSILELIPLFQFYFPVSTITKRSLLVNFRLIGRTCSHFGFGLLIFGVTAVSSWEKEDIRNIEVGESFYITSYEIIFKNIDYSVEKNFKKVSGSFEVMHNKKLVGTLYPEKRLYPSRNEVTTEASIKPTLLNDFYIVLGNKLDGNAWVVRTYIKPFISFIWFGVTLIALGGFVTLLSFASYRNRFTV
ncbi:MAG: heme lyase CcmF/NrfE family subunit [Alphaproteobacteria bacterium]|nr:MAG: heme lyase CcmF/NrfE family subunit [Alphaproteobacteria bacterium]